MATATVVQYVRVTGNAMRTLLTANKQNEFVMKLIRVFALTSAILDLVVVLSQREDDLMQTLLTKELLPVRMQRLQLVAVAKDLVFKACHKRFLIDQKTGAIENFLVSQDSKMLILDASRD